MASGLSRLIAMTLLEQFARRYARRTVRGANAFLFTDGDPLLIAAFSELGWRDPHIEDRLGWAVGSVEEQATVTDPERAVLPKSRRRKS